MKSIHHLPASRPVCLLARTIVGLALLTALPCYAQSIYEPYTFTTIAGKAGSVGSADGTNNASQFNYPYEVAMDSAGSLYVSDAGNNTIRKMTPVGTNWVVTTLAGKAGVPPNSKDGTNSAARFNSPAGVAMDTAGSLYVSDMLNHTLRKMTPAGTNWVVTTLAGTAGSVGSRDGTNSAARFNWPSSVALDSKGNLYVPDFLDNTIRKVTPVGTNWVVTTIAGKAGSVGSADGTGSVARFYGPGGVAVDTDGTVYVAEELNCTIRKVAPIGTDWVVTTIAGRAGSVGSADGLGRDARFRGPIKLALDGAGNLFVAESAGNTIRKMTPVGTNWVVTAIAGKAGVPGSADGTGSVAQFNFTHGMAVDIAGNIYVADASNNTIRKGYPALVISSPGFNGGQFAFNLTGHAGKVMVVEGSTDLVHWLPLWTNTLAGSPSFRDPGSRVQFSRFYRAQAK